MADNPVTDRYRHVVVVEFVQVVDQLHDLIRHGARDLIAKAVEAELECFWASTGMSQHPNSPQAVVRNGHMPKRTIQTDVGDVDFQEALSALVGEQIKGL